ncbi:NnrU family protein [Parvularcula marina]|uniref:NnrU family protein n=1 Tax=Parvularcula marina TaxID=2292771 RepID=UPI003515046F
MTIFLAGLALFIGIHLFTGLARGPRAAIIGKIGAMPYKGLFSLITLAGLILLIYGWKQVVPGEPYYVLPDWVRYITYFCVWIALILTVAANLPAGKIAAMAKHPMVLGMKLWAFGHLLANGDLRSVILFGAVLAWGVIDRIALKKRGDMGRPFKTGFGDVLAITIGTAGFAVILLWAHVYIAGVPLF